MFAFPAYTLSIKFAKLTENLPYIVQFFQGCSTEYLRTEIWWKQTHNIRRIQIIDDGFRKIYGKEHGESAVSIFSVILQTFL